MRWLALLFLLIAFPAQAQQYQCRTSPVGASTSYCASEAFVTQSAAAAGDVTGPVSSTAGHVATFADSTGKLIQDGGVGGTVTEQKNTFGYGLTPSGNCDNTTTNASSPCNASVNLSAVNNSLGADVLMNNTANYFDGPSVAQGTSGAWWADGTVSLTDTSAASQFFCKLWDGTTVIASAATSSGGAGFGITLSLHGYLAAPAANIRISCRDTLSTSGKILFNSSGNSKDSSLFVHRIQ